MKLFLDTADITEIQAVYDTGLLDGVTTNPSLVAKEGKSADDLYQAIAAIGVQDISMEVMGGYDRMLSEALRLYETYRRVCTVKLPMTAEGLRVCVELSKRNIRTNVTLIFDTAQAILASKAGASYVSPFVGRVDDNGYDGVQLVGDIAGLYAQTKSPTQVLAASIRTGQAAVQSFENGADIVTMPPKVFWSMYDHVLTKQGLDIFEKAAGV